MKKHCISLALLVCSMFMMSSCSEKQVNSQETTSVQTALTVSGTSAETSASAETTAASSEETSAVTAGAPEKSFGAVIDALDVLSVTSVSGEISDIDAFGHAETIKLLREKCFSDYSKAIEKYNETVAEIVSSPDDILFVRGLVYDFNKDKEEDIIVNLMYAPKDYDDYTPAPGCVLYYVDGKSGKISEMIGGGISDSGEMNYDVHCCGSTADRIEEIWDLGDFTVLKAISGFSPLSSHNNLFRIRKDSAEQELIAYSPDIFTKDNLCYRLDSFSMGYLPHPAVFTADGSFRKVGFEEIEKDDFFALVETDETLKNKFMREAESRFGSAEPDIIQKVFTCGYKEFMIYCLPELKENDFEKYIYFDTSDIYYDYPPIIIDTEYNDEYLYGINLNNLNFINRKKEKQK